MVHPEQLVGLCWGFSVREWDAPGWRGKCGPSHEGQGRAGDSFPQCSEWDKYQQLHLGVSIQLGAIGSTNKGIWGQVMVLLWNVRSPLAWEK